MKRAFSPRIVEYRPNGKWYLCWVVAIKPEGILEVQIPNPNGLAWRIDLWPNEYKVIS